MSCATADFFMEKVPQPLCMALRVTLLCAFAMYSQLLCGEAHGQDVLDMKERFLNEAPKAWEKFEGRAKRLQGSFLSKFVLPGGEVELHTILVIKKAHGFAR